MSNEDDMRVKFPELLKGVRVIDSKNRQRKLGDCIDFELEDLMYAINEYNKSGKLVIELNIDVAERNELNIQAVVKTTKPRGKKPNNPYFRDQKGNLYMDDPNQIKLFNTSQVVEMRETHQKGAAND